MIQFIVNMSLVIGIPLALLILYNNLDKEVDLNVCRKNIIIMLIYSVVSELIIQYTENTTYWLFHNTILIAYLIFNAYTDTQLKIIYSAISYLMIVFEIVNIAYNIDIVKDYFNKLTWTVLIIVGILLFVTIILGQGLGDFLIFIVLTLYYIQVSDTPTISLSMNVLITYIVFIVYYIVDKIRCKIKNKEFDGKKPLALCILISTIICIFIEI